MNLIWEDATVAVFCLCLAQVTVAGCSSPTDADNGQDNGPVGGETWSQPVTLASKHGAMAVGPDDVVHFVAEQNGRAVHRRSEDEGATWSDPVTIADAVRPARTYGALAVGEDGVIHFLSQTGAADPSTGNLLYHRSTDDGTTWSHGTQLNDGAADRPVRTHIRARDGVVHVVNGKAGTKGSTDHHLYYWRSSDNGVTWSGTRQLDSYDSVNDVLTVAPAVAAGPNGAVHVAYHKGPNGQGILGTAEAWYVRSTDAGASWGAPVKVTPEFPQYRSRVEAMGSTVLIFHEEPQQLDGYVGTESEISMVRSLDSGESWEERRLVTDASPDYPNHHEVAVDPAGSLHLVYLLSERQDSPIQDAVIIYQASKDFGSTWSVPQVVLDIPGVRHGVRNLAASSGYVHLILDEDKQVRYLRSPLQ